MKIPLLLAIFGIAVGMAFGQSTVFDLRVPAFGDLVFDADVVDLPGRLPTELVIFVHDPYAQDIPYGRLEIKLNGESCTHIGTMGSRTGGKAVSLDLRLRQDEHLIPGKNTLEVLATTSRGRRFYRNFIIRTKEAARSEYFSYESKVSPLDETAMPPDISLLEPEFPIQFGPNEATRKVRLKGTVTGSKPLSSLRVNGKSIAVSGTDVEFDETIAIAAATRSILIEAVDAKANKSAVTIPVRLSSSPPPRVSGGEKYAVVIGISEYQQNSGLASLHCASLDAKDFAAKLMSNSSGWKKENVFLFTDENATAAQVRNALRRLVATPQRDDLLVIYYAGYGFHDRDQPTRLYLGAYDTQAGQLTETAVSMDELKAAVTRGIRSRHTLLFFDVARPLSNSWKAPGTNLVNDYLLRLGDGDPTKAVMVSSGVGENSIEPESGNSLFADALMRGLDGRADGNHDRILTIREWFTYAATQVRNLSGGQVSPKYRTGSDDSALLALR